jgi:hypothetical protein
MTLQLLHSEFPYIWGKFDFLFYQCSCYSISRSLQVPARRLEAPAVGISGSWFLRRETSCYSISRSLQVPARRLEAPAVGISGSWLLRRETSCYSISRSLQVPARRLEAPAVGISGSWFLRWETRSYKAGRTGGARQATTLFKVRTIERGIFDRLMFKMHYSKLLVKTRPSCFLMSWMQCLSKIFSPKAASAVAGWPSGGRNEYFCRPHHLKEAKMYEYDAISCEENLLGDVM